MIKNCVGAVILLASNRSLLEAQEAIVVGVARRQSQFNVRVYGRQPKKTRRLWPGCAQIRLGNPMLPPYSSDQMMAPISMFSVSGHSTPFRGEFLIPISKA
jgi:hypothetical protein